MSRSYFISIVAATVVVAIALHGTPADGAEARPAADEPVFSLHPPASPVEKALVKSVSFEFHAMALKDAVAAIAKSTGVKISLDETALANAKIDLKTPVTFDGPRMPLRAALERLLGGHDLAYHVTAKDSLTITARMPGAEALTLKTYDVKDLAEKSGADGKPVAKPYHWLVEAITGTVAPTAWDESGGQATIAVAGDKLVVKQTPEEHEVLADCLALLRIARDQPEKIRQGYPRIAGASEELAKALLTRHDFNFKATPLAEVAKSLAKFNLPVELDEKALANSHIDLQTPITFNAEQIAGDEMLDRIVAQTDGGCCYEFEGDTVLLSAQECGSIGRFAIYPVGEIVEHLNKTAAGKDPFAEISAQIQKAVLPETWNDSGGSGTIAALPVVKALLIVQNREGHKECKRFFATIRAKSNQK